MEGAIKEAVIKEVEKRPQLYDDITSEEGAGIHEVLWNQVFTAVVPNWDTLDHEKKAIIGKNIKDEWLKGKASHKHKHELKAENKTMLKQNKIKPDNSTKFRRQNFAPRQFRNKQTWNSEDIKEQECEHAPNLNARRWSLRSTKKNDEASDNLRDQGQVQEADLIESFNRVLKPLPKRNPIFKPNTNPCEIKGDNPQFMDETESQHNISLYKTADFHETEYNYLNPSRRNFPATQFKKPNSHFASLDTETNVTHSNSYNRRSLSSYHDGANQNINSPIRSPGATPSHFSAPNHFQTNRLDRSHNFRNPSSLYSHKYDHPHKLNPYAPIFEPSSHRFPSSSIFPPHSNPYFTVPSFNSQIKSKQSSLNPPTSLSNTSDPSSNITKSPIPNEDSHSRDPQNNLIPSNSSDEQDNLYFSNPLNASSVVFDHPTPTEPSNTSQNLPNSSSLNPPNTYSTVYVPFQSSNQRNAFPNSFNAYPTQGPYNQCYRPGYLPLFPNPSNPYNPINPYLQNIRKPYFEPLHVDIPNEDGSLPYNPNFCPFLN